ncbi:hypothetical protein P3342_009825 [Pyrenophora teres f. teres]|nr:hypothetical protein P3342_009825 [Pyrenophora teres f. teres]
MDAPSNLPSSSKKTMGAETGSRRDLFNRLADLSILPNAKEALESEHESYRERQTAAHDLRALREELQVMRTQAEFIKGLSKSIDKDAAEELREWVGSKKFADEDKRTADWIDKVLENHEAIISLANDQDGEEGGQVETEEDNMEQQKENSDASSSGVGSDKDGLQEENPRLAEFRRIMEALKARQPEH